MEVACFSIHRFEEPLFKELNSRIEKPHEMDFFDVALNEGTGLLGQGYPCICAFVSDRLSRSVIAALVVGGLKHIALRSAGFNHVDLAACKELGVSVTRVPAYSPHAVAEHALALILALNRKIHRAYARVRELNFSLEGLVGFDMNGKVAGVIGTGKIGSVLVRILSGLGCRVLAFDPKPNRELAAAFDVDYVGLDELYASSDIITLQTPLTEQTRHLISLEAIGKMKDGVILINTGRGALIDTRALIEGLKSGRIGGAGLDVYEEEEKIFFKDLSGHILHDDVLARLLTFPNVIITAHQAFLTKEALHNIVETTLDNITAFELGRPLRNKIET